LIITLREKRRKGKTAKNSIKDVLYLIILIITSHPASLKFRCLKNFALNGIAVLLIASPSASLNFRKKKFCLAEQFVNSLPTNFYLINPSLDNNSLILMGKFTRIANL
jgi:hypothetical protein